MRKKHGNEKKTRHPFWVYPPFEQNWRPQQWNKWFCSRYGGDEALSCVWEKPRVYDSLGFWIASLGNFRDAFIDSDFERLWFLQEPYRAPLEIQPAVRMQCPCCGLVTVNVPGHTYNHHARVQVAILCEPCLVGNLPPRLAALYKPTKLPFKEHLYVRDWHCYRMARNLAISAAKEHLECSALTTVTKRLVGELVRAQQPGLPRYAKI